MQANKSISTNDMNVDCEGFDANHLNSMSQKARVISESWFSAEAYCIACPSASLAQARTNSIARDFTCSLCGQSYELKSSLKAQLVRVADGAYKTMLERVRSSDAPALIILRYRDFSASGLTRWTIDQLTAIHPIFLTDSVIEPRKPLSLSAKRAGWQGCNIRIDRIPSDGKIALVADGIVSDPESVRHLYKSSCRLSEISFKDRDWTSSVLSIVRKIDKSSFNLNEVYAHKARVEQAFPNNRNVEAKIRQQLQVLRDLGYLKFASRGRYEVVP